MVIFEREKKEIEAIRRKKENVFAIGNMIRTNRFDGWLRERLTGLNSNVKYIHNKFMLIDPLGKNPIVVTGSANFSVTSTKNNDENMVIVRGNQRVADIYLSEYMKLFSHMIDSIKIMVNDRMIDASLKKRLDDIAAVFEI